MGGGCSKGFWNGWNRSESRGAAAGMCGNDFGILKWWLGFAQDVFIYGKGRARLRRLFN